MTTDSDATKDVMGIMRDSFRDLIVEHYGDDPSEEEMHNMSIAISSVIAEYIFQFKPDYQGFMLGYFVNHITYWLGVLNGICQQDDDDDNEKMKKQTMVLS